MPPPMPTTPRAPKRRGSSASIGTMVASHSKKLRRSPSPHQDPLASIAAAAVAFDGTLAPNAADEHAGTSTTSTRRRSARASSKRPRGTPPAPVAINGTPAPDAAEEDRAASTTSTTRRRSARAASRTPRGTPLAPVAINGTPASDPAEDHAASITSIIRRFTRASSKTPRGTPLAPVAINGTPASDAAATSTTTKRKPERASSKKPRGTPLATVSGNRSAAPASQSRPKSASSTRTKKQTPVRTSLSKYQAPTSLPSTSLPHPAPGNYNSLWSYIKANVPELTVTAYEDLPSTLRHSDFKLNASLPRLRDIQWNPNFKGKERFSAKWAVNPVSLAVYLTGKVAESPCSKCANGSGTYIGCVLPNFVSTDDVLMCACANCIYNWQAAKCSLYVPNRERREKHAREEEQRAREEAERALGINVAGVEAFFAAAGEGGLEAAANQAAWTQPNIKTKRPARKSTKTPRPQQFVAIDNTPMEQLNGTPNDPSNLDTAGAHHVTSTQPGQLMSLSQGLTLEDWEIHPGTLEAAGMPDAPNTQVAFSAPLLSHAHSPVKVHRNLGLSLVKIGPGTLYRPAVQADYARTCIVSAGRVRIKIEDESFDVTMHGAFKISEGQQCEIENRLAIEAALHILDHPEF